MGDNGCKDECTCLCAKGIYRTVKHLPLKYEGEQIGKEAGESGD